MQITTTATNYIINTHTTNAKSNTIISITATTRNNNHNITTTATNYIINTYTTNAKSNTIINTTTTNSNNNHNITTTTTLVSVFVCFNCATSKQELSRNPTGLLTPSRSTVDLYKH